jgi:hypothetical protein
MSAIPGTSGEFPVVMPNPLPEQKVLRPLRQPIYDTECLPGSGGPAIQRVDFFQRPLSQNTASGAIPKSHAETNLTQAGQLPNPNEFSIFGFIVEPTPDIMRGLPAAGVVTNTMTLADFITIYEASVFEFTFTGNRVYLQIRTMQIPSGVGPTGAMATITGQTTVQASVGMVTNGVPHCRNYYPFNIGKYALRIRSSETFGACIRWPQAAVASGLAVPRRIACYIVGIMYSAI